MRLLMKESYTVDYAGFWLRLTAIIIDGLILWGINYLINGLWNVFSGLPWMGAAAEQTGATVSTTFGEWIWRVTLVFVIQLVYFIGLPAWRGQTPGKMIMRLKITRLDGSAIGLGAAVMRYLGYIISFFSLLLGFIWIFFDTRKQGFHDKIADTYVIRIPRKQAELPSQTMSENLPH